MKKLYIILAITFLTLSSAYGYEGDLAQVGSPAPAFSAVSIDGSEVSLSSLKGRAVLLVFFATWCNACSAEMPFIEQEIWQALKSEGFVVIGIGRGHQKEELTEYKASKGISFELLPDPGREIYSQYATKKIPRCYVIGKDGIIKFGSVGFSEKNNNELEEAIVSELNK